MGATPTRWFGITLPESSVVLLGLVLALAGLAFQDSFGFSAILASVGISLVIAGTVYVAAVGPELVRFALVFVSLVAVQLLAISGVTRWIGGIALGCVVVAVAYSRLSKSATSEPSD